MKYKNILTIDFECFFDTNYTLKKMATSLYVRDDRYKTQSCAMMYNDTPIAAFGDDDEIINFFEQIDWTDTAILCHHTQFDGLILGEKYGIYPAYYLDTMSMARALIGNRVSVSLDAVADYLGIDRKSDDVTYFKGKRDLTPEDLLRLIEYNKHDVKITREIFDVLKQLIPESEMDLIDLTIRMFTQPGFEIDVNRAQIEHTKEVKIKADMMETSGLTKEMLHSSDKFAEWLKAQGVNPPMKHSLKQDKDVFAFAKTDTAFVELLEHENERVRFGVEARLSIKSTGNETRALRFVNEGRLGPLPVYLAYYGAHTGRWSGGNKINLQNLKRGGELRKCLIAPRGYVIGVVDSGQIECRVNAWLSGELSLLESFKKYDAGDKAYDPYRLMASKIYDIPIDQITSEQRFVGKIAVLGLGFQMGGPKYQATLASGAMGMKVEVELQKAYDIVRLYRQNNSHIVDMWAKCESIISELYNGEIGGYGCIHWQNNKIYLPNGMYLDYYDLDYRDNDDGRAEPSYKAGNMRKKLYGGVILENIVQALARIIVSTQMQEISKRYKVLTMTHDEVVALIPEAEADEGWAYMHKCMTTSPDWCSDLPLSAEGGYDTMYSK